MPITIASPEQLDGQQRAAVLELADEIEAADGAPPLSDQGRSQLTSSKVRHFIATDGADLLGYAQLNAASAELLGQPTALMPLLDALQSAAPASELELWAHGTRSRLLTVLDGRGYERDRVLWQLRRPATPIAPIAPPAGVVIRPFTVGGDEAAWLAVNAAAFAHHPEQGGWTRTDLEAREAEPWFDPAGFLLAERDDELLGFHWTKRHTATLGEVYVIAVAPAAQGLQLGTVLLVAGLEQLRRDGATEVLLYVDESNSRAMTLYEKHGFRRFDQDVQYRLPAAS
jgi:mycothiol synthase